MKLDDKSVWLAFDIWVEGKIKIGEVQIKLNKEAEIEKWKNPILCEKEVLESFTKEFPQYSYFKLHAYHTADTIPFLK